MAESRARIIERGGPLGDDAFMIDSPSRVLVVDAGDDGEALTAAFTGEGFEVRVVDAAAASGAMADFAPDLLLIDLRHGRQLPAVRKMISMGVPTAEGTDGEEQTAARAQRLLAEMQPDDLRSDDDELIIDLAQQATFRRGRPLALTSTELMLLAVLVREEHLVVSKDRLLQLLWGPEASNVNVVEVHISSLRRKLEEIGPRLIRTVRGVGYVFGGLNPAPFSPAGARLAGR